MPLCCGGILLIFSHVKMDVDRIREIIDGELLFAPDAPYHYTSAFASDLMSDVLTLDTENLILITGLTNLQAIRTAEMADIPAIVFVRNKKANQEMLEVAIENGMCILESPYSLFKSSGLLYQAGLKPIY